MNEVKERKEKFLDGLFDDFGNKTFLALFLMFFVWLMWVVITCMIDIFSLKDILMVSFAYIISYLLMHKLLK